jgi:hypothetical protein
VVLGAHVGGQDGNDVAGEIGIYQALERLERTAILLPEHK